ncbi:hypothetical protein WR25_23190 [Diploscapter pachys]|uniref:Clc-like protein n=1 Tax=Diploscapter pachys TaxID=2018661 RepID=A0A2A2KMT5_9BILA|nr:hypothetical protein WR25_23190 [Diploscapter pachys]
MSHQHGLWWDCKVHHNVLIPLDQIERERIAHHKGVLFFSVFTILFALIGAIIGICSPCFPPNSLLYVVSIFMTIAAYLLIKTRHARDVCCTSKKEYIEEERRLRWQNSGLTLKSGKLDRTATRPFVIVDDESSSA